MWRREKIALSWGLCMLSLISAGAIASASSIDPARQAGRKREQAAIKSAQNGVPSKTCSKTMRIAVSPQSPALNVNRQNQVSGILSDFFSSLEDSTACRFSWDFVPRARAIHYLKHGLTDIVFAIRTDERDQYAEFIPLLEFYPSLVVMNDAVRGEDQEHLLEQEQLRFGFIRGYDFGKDYLEFVERSKLAKRGVEFIEIEDVARRMDSGQINASIMPATVFVQAAQDILLDKKIQAIPLNQFSKAKVGIYLSHHAVKAEDRLILREAIGSKNKIDLFYRLFRSHYPAWAMKAINPASPSTSN